MASARRCAPTPARASPSCCGRACRKCWPDTAGVQHMKTWQHYLRLLKYQPLMYTINLLGIIGAFLLGLLPGLLVREYFNLLSGAAPARFGLTTLIALLAAGAAGRMIFYFLLPMTNTPFVYTCGALLRKNLLAR